MEEGVRQLSYGFEHEFGGFVSLDRHILMKGEGNLGYFFVGSLRNKR